MIKLEKLNATIWKELSILSNDKNIIGIQRLNNNNELIKQNKLIS